MGNRAGAQLHATPLLDSGLLLAYGCGFTFSSNNVPLSSFTLFLSELTTDPCEGFEAGESFRFEIPTTPCVWPVI